LSDELIKKIQRLKTQRNAVILAHNYQPGEIQDIADFCGDSLALSIQASKATAEVIVFCGVRFMAETAAILCPKKTVLLPEKTAGCPMADMITAPQLRELKEQHPGALVVCYVNSTADVKAESDYCCTSSNAVEVVNSLPADKKILFVPDKNLGQFVAERTGRDILLWPGYCATHTVITVDDVKNAKAKYPDAVVLAHPECTLPVRELADELLSTGRMLTFAAKSSAKRFIIATETGIIHTLRKQAVQAGKNTEFIPASARATCPNMKKITLDKVVFALEDMQYQVTVDVQIRTRAKKALDRMIEILPEK
jgi:quinolinate synthase